MSSKQEHPTTLTVTFEEFSPTHDFLDYKGTKWILPTGSYISAAVSRRLTQLLSSAAAFEPIGWRRSQGVEEGARFGESVCISEPTLAGQTNTQRQARVADDSEERWRALLPDLQPSCLHEHSAFFRESCRFHLSGSSHSGGPPVCSGRC